MRSIIDEIATAEAQAEQIRQTAAAQAREQISNARDFAEQALVALVAQEREETESAMGEAVKQGERVAQETQVRMEREADAICARAENKIEQAIAYLVEKVIHPA